MIGVLARITRGRKPEDFLCLSDEPNKRYTFVASSKLLHGYIGMNAVDAMLFLGFSKEWIHARLLDKPPTHFKLVVFPKTDAVLATWENLFTITKNSYGNDVYIKIQPFEQELQTTTYEAIDPALRIKKISELPIDERYAHDEFITPERFQALSHVTIYHARAFFYHTLGCNLHYIGNGLSSSGDEEWLVPNHKIDDIPGAVVVDLEVRPEHL
jgi:hypothetical protein